MTTHRQLDLFSSVRRPVADVQSFLIASAGKPVRLTLTRNRVSMISVVFRPEEILIRMNEAFLTAPDSVLQALGGYLRSRSKAHWRLVGHYIRTLVPEGGREPAGDLRTAGRFYDLAVIRDRVNHRHFNGRLKCQITWGRAGRRRRRARSRTIRFGSYAKAQDLIRIHPLLDDPRVPLEFVEYIVFHEMLHAVVPVDAAGARPHHHTTYRSLERRYPGYAHMRRLSAELVRRLS